MNYNYYKFGLAMLLWLFCTNVNAADISAGKSRSAVCQGCHGSTGISPNPQWPNLAGQTPVYLEAQLRHFKSGMRINPIMKPMADGLGDADIQNVAAYFAGLPANTAGGDANLAKQGKDKTFMCMGCHGEKLKGQGQFPRLAGQQSQYLSKQLHDFKSGERKADHMNAVAKSMSDDDIKAISAYIASLTN